MNKESIQYKILKWWYDWSGQLGKYYLLTTYGTTNTRELMYLFKKDRPIPFKFIGDYAENRMVY